MVEILTAAVANETRFGTKNTRQDGNMTHLDEMYILLDENYTLLYGNMT